MGVVIDGTRSETSDEPCWYVTATWNLWTIDRLVFRAAGREPALAEAQRRIALRSPDALEHFGEPEIVLHDSFRDDGSEPYRQVRKDFEPETDPAMRQAYREEVAAEAAKLLARLREGRGVLIGYTSRRSPIDYGLFFVDVYDATAELARVEGIDVVGGRCDDIGLELRPR